MKLTSGAITVPVERDGVMTGSITFNPEDVTFARRFYALSEGLGEREQEYGEALRDDRVQVGERLRLLADICGWLREQMDIVFGAGCSDTVFGDQCSPELFQQFFAGVEPIIRRGRAAKTKQYTSDSGDVME